MARDLCWSCKSFKEIAWTEEGTSRPFCAGCMKGMPVSGEAIAWAIVLMTVPFKPGDRVECRTGAELFDGIGVVREISMDLEHGGTPVYPAFRVTIEEKAYDSVPDELWYTEVCLTKVPEQVKA